MSLFNKIFIQCKEATYLHEKKRAGKLDAAESLGLWIHMLYCSFCRQFVKQVEFLEATAHKFYQTAEKRFHLSPTRKGEMQKAFEQELKK